MAVEDASARAARLSDARRAMLERRLRGVAPAGIPRRAEPGPAPLLVAQEQLWIVDQLDPGSAAYTLPCALWLRGPLDQLALEEALHGLVCRHEGLRTRFPLREGRPVQLVEPAVRRPLPTVAVAGDDAGERRGRARDLMAEAAAEPFDLAGGPLHRAVLYRLGEREHCLLLLLHHMVADAWSQRVLAEDLAALYEAALHGVEPRLPDVRVQPADVAAWQRRRLDDPAMRAHLEHWRQRLGGELPRLELPSYRPRPAMPSTRGGIHRHELAPELVAALGRLARGSRATPYMTMLTAFAALLSRYTGETDVVVGTTVADRGRAELERVVANLVNTLAIRVDCSGDPTFAELLNRTRAAVLDAMAHSAAPYARVVEVARPARTPGENPLFQVLFVLQDVSVEPLEAAGLVVEAENPDTDTTQFDVVLTVQGGLCHYRYRTDLLDHGTVVALAAHLETVLRGAVAAPETALSRLPVLPEAERDLLLREWNATNRPYPHDRCVHELFEERAREAPGAVAVIGAAETLTYAELNRRANRVAHRLRRDGVRPDDLVGICVERSPDMLVAILGVLKAGAGYVPVEPAHPPARVHALLEAAGARLVLTQERFRELAAGGRRATLCLDSDRAAIEREPETDPDPRAVPDNLLYVMFTSGSTGRPKGVMTTHRNVVDVMAFLLRTYRLTAEDRVLQHLPYSFDMSDGEVFLPLLAGAAIVLAPAGGRWDPQRLLETVREHGVTSVQFVPAVFPVLLEGDAWDRCTSLRHVLSGGDALPATLNGELLRRTRGVVHNFYGPTETTMGMTYWRCEPLEAHRIAPIGRPIENTRTYVLDAALEPVPVGVAGELFIAGVTLARGYLGSPGATAERFLPDPHGPEPGARMYRSGDLARYLPDGDLEFIGRADHQVKLRGFRIEPDEVAVALGHHDDVGQAVVMVREDAPGGRALVAYAAGADGRSPGADDLRRFLRGRLPDHMVPSFVVVVDAFPLTPAGKVDRRKLPVPGAAGGTIGGADDPATALERTIAEAWRQVLGVPRVGLHDNFFDLGGHSLLMVQLRQRLAERLDRPPDLVDLFSHPTVRAQAEHVGGGPRGGEAAGAERVSATAERQRAALRRAARGRGLRSPGPGGPGEFDGRQ